MDNIDTAYLESYKQKYVYTCPKCGGKDSNCTCWAGVRFEIQKICAGIPIKYRGFTFDKFTHPELQKVKDVIRLYCKDIRDYRTVGKSLFLHGTKGLAKTASASLILMYALANKMSGIYFESLDTCVQYLWKEWENRQNDSTIKEKIINYDFLVIDGFGELSRDFKTSGEVLRGAFKERANNMLPTIFVSSTLPNELSSVLEKQIYSEYEGNIQLIKFAGFNFEKEVLEKAKRKRVAKKQKAKESLDGEEAAKSVS